MQETCLVVVDPGHFHATLVQQEMYPGVAAEALGREWRIGVPEPQRIGHDAAFAEFTRRFLAAVADPSSRQARERFNLPAKYYVTTEAVARSLA